MLHHKRRALARRILTTLLALIISPATCMTAGTVTCTVPEESRTIVLLGDSNTWIGGDNCDNERGWNCHFARLHPHDSIRSYARSGATWTATASSTADITHYSELLADNNIIYNQALRLIDDIDNRRVAMPEIIIAGGGTNDAWFSNRRPGIFDMTPCRALDIPSDSISLTTPSSMTSLAGSVRLDIELLRRHCPGARIIIMTPLSSSRIPARRLECVSDIMEHTATGMGAGVIRLDRVCRMDTDAERITPTLTTDGIHTSELGARAVAEAVDRCLEELLKTD